MGYSDQSEYPSGVFHNAAVTSSVNVTSDLNLKVSAIVVSAAAATVVTVADANGSVYVLELGGAGTERGPGFEAEGQLTVAATISARVTVLYWQQ